MGSLLEVCTLSLGPFEERLRLIEDYLESLPFVNSVVVLTKFIILYEN